MSYGPLNTATMRSAQIARSVGQLAAIAERAATGEEPATAEAILAGARFLAHEAEVLDPTPRATRVERRAPCC
jgi:quinolinate synthase